MALVDVSMTDLLEGDLFELLGLAEADQDKKDKILAEMMDVVNLRAIERIANQLGEQKAEEFKYAAENGTPEQLANFLAAHEVNLPEILQDEAMAYRVEIVELMRLATTSEQ